MSENTPQLDLLMKDPTLDGHEYFNVKTMMNDNWEKIDKFAGEAKTSIAGLEDRLNTKAEEEVVLNGGVQIVDAVKAAPFNLTGLKGRTLVNLIGRAGNCEDPSKFSSWQATLTADTTNKTQGNQAIKITTTASPGGSGASAGFAVKAGSYYFIAADVKLGSGISIGAYLNGLTSTKGNTNSTDTAKFKTVWKAYSVTTAATVYAVGEVVGAAGSVGYIDGIRVYEISDTEYTALSNMTADQIALKYPYVDSVTPVRNPYAIRHGENLFPPFYEHVAATTGSTLTVISPYEAVLTTTATTQPWNSFINIVGGQTYTLSYTSSVPDIAYINIQWHDAAGIPLGYTPANQNGQTVIAPNNAVRAKTLVTATAAGTFIISNPMLNIGNKALPFVPREDAMLALQTDLYADPLTGTSADSVFEQNGQYFKAKKWHQFKIDNNITFVTAASTTGRKQIVIRLPAAGVINSELVTKFTGSILQTDQNMAGPDRSGIDYGDRTLLHISVANTDSGWGDAYAPSADEIKAYFLGWVMYDGSLAGGAASPNNPAGNTYNGTGSRAWCYRTDGVSRTYAGPTATLPTTQAPVWTPYELVYQLVTPTVESIVSEGQLTLNEGSNQVEVGTGIVLREGAKPQLYSNYDINTGKTAANALKHAVKSYLTLYANGRRLYRGWATFSGDNGPAIAIYPQYYDPSAAYSVTYLMQATFPIQPMTGIYAGNEKSLLNNLVNSVTQQEIRLAAVENKKAEKDSPALMKLTLLNGFTGVSGYYDYVSGFYISRDSEGYVHTMGLINNGVAASAGNPSLIARLPVGYRPKNSFTFSAPYYSSTGGGEMTTRIKVANNGDVYSFCPHSLVAPSDWMSLHLPPFLVEQ
ncbi:hypothetical protein ACE41H_09790 [Paenibacillus enshidis]|uniref:Uncharacterized protein n=1 Tax=Paenibacillus enshidis TaxID=1458439 RepID=A0ABV5AS78_9BACL